MKAIFEVRVDGQLADCFSTKDYNKAYVAYDNVVKILGLAKANTKVELILIDNKLGNDRLACTQLVDGRQKERVN